MKKLDRYQLVGWVAVALSTIITCFWAYWGIIENFHEGWFYESLLANLGLMFAQYLSFMLIFIGVTLVSLHWPRIGAGLHVIGAFFAFWFFGGASNTASLLIIAPLLIFAALYWYGRPLSRKIATYLIIGLPLLTLIIFGVEPVMRVSQRLNDGNLGARVVAGNGVELTWAPDGPGWPPEGMNWHEASRACQYLAEDGTALATTPQNIWRLPTVDEAVRSMARHGENSGGVWNAAAVQATYHTTPDKESPLWNVYSQVIYWWTATEADEADAYIIVYDGKVWPRDKDFGPAYLGFRCIK
ncbi:MAG: hypothetical protein R3E79_55835 [Caldilineaceae bacterium]